MLKNYFRITLRNMKRHPGYSTITILGLAIGMACCLCITLWISDELSYDRFHADTGQLYQVLGNGKNWSTPIPLAPALKREFPEVLYASRYSGYGEPLFRRGDKAFYENGVRVVDPDFFSIFSFPFLKGDPRTALNDIHSIVISEDIARKFFPAEDPMGKNLTMNDERDFTVTGVMQNIPENSTLRFDIAIPYEIRIQDAQRDGADPYSWDWWSPSTFVKLQNHTPTDIFNRKITGFFREQVKDQEDFLSLLPFTERAFFFWDTKTYITIFSVIAVFLLLLACINFINLSTARSASRSAEIGIRKVAGAFRKNLFIQFMGESLLQTFTALLISLLLVSFSLSLFNSVTGKHLTANSLVQPPIPLIAIGMTLFAGLASGSYPALVLSSFRPAGVLKGQLNRSPKGSLFRKILVVFQFSISITLIIATIVVQKQLNYIKTKETGFVKEHLMTVSLKGESKDSYDVLKNRLLSDDRILGVTGVCDNLPYFRWTTSSIDWEGKDPNREIQVGFNFVDYNFVQTLGITLLEGRDFAPDFVSDVEASYIVNEAFVKLMNLESAVGRPLTVSDKPGKIVGVIQNTHFQPLTIQINPIFFGLNPDQVNHMVIRIPSEHTESIVAFISTTWQEIIPMYPFEYQFVQEAFDRTYLDIERIRSLAGLFTFIAVFIGCLGLFGLSLFTSEQRSKEIGIRKILGASVPGIVFLLSKEFTTWVIISNGIAWPVAYIAMNHWLQDFAYRTDIGILSFISAATLTLLIALVTVSLESIKTALANPMESLRYE